MIAEGGRMVGKIIILTAGGAMSFEEKKRQSQ
jgi:hypothetical protein